LAAGVNFRPALAVDDISIFHENRDFKNEGLFALYPAAELPIRK
jgi:hypothetical protein